MPYSKSLARKDFESNISLILKACKESKLKKNGLSELALNMILHAAIFKVSALLEEYIKNIITDWLFLVQRNSCLNKELPENLRWFLAANSQINIFRNFLHQQNEEKLIENIKEKKTNLAIIDDNKFVANSLDPRRVVGDRKYPSTKNIKALFIRIGIPKIFEIINKKRGKDFKLITQSFLDIREAIAHQNPPNLPYSDIRMHLHNMLDFVGTLDRVLFNHIIAHSGVSYWRTN